jgi:hypothetical protein
MMPTTSNSAPSTPGLRRLQSSPPEDLEEDLLQHLLTGCVLLLLHETSATRAQLDDALAAVRLHDYSVSMQRVLETMERDGLVFSTSGPMLHIAPAGTRWLCEAAGELQRSEGFLGAFLARCGERLV